MATDLRSSIDHVASTFNSSNNLRSYQQLASVNVHGSRESEAQTEKKSLPAIVRGEAGDTNTLSEALLVID